MSPLRTVLAVVVVASLALAAGCAGIAQEDTPQPFVDVQTDSPTAENRQTMSETPTPGTDAESRTSRPDTGTLTPTASPSPSPTATTDGTSTEASSNDPGTDGSGNGAGDTDGSSGAATSTERRTSSRETGDDDGQADETVTSEDTPTETEDRSETDTDEESTTPTETPADAPNDDGDAGDAGARQCTQNRDGQYKPPLPSAVSPPGDAQSMTLGEEVRGEIGPDGTEWYAVSVQRGETLSLVSSDSPEGLSIAVFGPDGSPLDAHEVRTPDRTAFGVTVDRSGTYYVRVTAGDGYGGFYGLTAEVAGPDSFDPNDGRQRALPVAFGEPTEATLSEGETDWFAVNLSANASVAATVDVAGHALGRDLRVDIYDADGDRLSTAGAETRFIPPGGSGTATATATVQEAGTYYVRVSCASLDGHANYTVTVDTGSEG